MHAVVSQQVGIGLDRTQIVHGNDLDVPAIGFGYGAQDVAADAAKPVNGNAYCHENTPGSFNPPRPP
jgi:hypothetical protein